MEWIKLLSSERHFEPEKEKGAEYFEKYPISEFEKDYKQIISSSAFRRLQDKTQVFPLDKSDFVRTRLTHSIEVSTIAKQLGMMILNNETVLGKKGFKDGEHKIEDIPSILSCAGLLHDIGNPPFGHFGEVIIGDWFKNAFEKDDFKYGEKSIKSILNEQMRNDLMNFEGNAQALRLLTKTTDNGYNTNLSYAVLNTLIKYPTNSCHFSKDDKDIKKHKMGYFYSENKIMDEICNTTGTKMDSEGGYYRHPLTFFMEAADDIAYSTADLEDALKKGLFTLDDFIAYYENSLKEIKLKYPDNSNASKKRKSKFDYSKDLLEELKKMIKKVKKRNTESDFNIFCKWINWVKKWLMYVTAYRFSDSYHYIMDGTYNQDLFYDTNHEHTIKILKGAMQEFVFNDVEILKLELSAKKILEALLNDFIYAVIYWKEDEYVDKLPKEDKQKYKFSKADKKYVDIIPQNLRDEYLEKKPKDESERLYFKFLMVTDFISGMTDSYAKNLYQELYGMK